jgi:hypothetical protein
MCPADYFYPPAAFARRPEIETEVLYVVGGLYGNLTALTAIEQLAAAEAVNPTIVFNGDFHWFDATPDWFEAIERGVRPHLAVRGNVETEIARTDDLGAGCGCAYPEGVDDGTVQRSNAILRELRGLTREVDRARLCALPMHLVAHVGALRVAVVHGDACALAGWRFARAHLDNPAQRPWLSGIHAAAQVDVFASTHTCAAALRDFALPSGRLTVINNGAAGMPNFRDTRFGVITRIATSPSPHAPLYGLERDGVHIDALALAYDCDAFLTRFDARWPQGSPAHISYRRRLVHGPDDLLAKAAPR